MHKQNIFSIIVIVLFIAAIGFLLVRNTTVRDSVLSSSKQVKIAGQTINVDVATTQGEQEQGLSGRAKLNGNEGMLFVFDHPDHYNFWMKDMNFSIDMIWISADKKVIFIKEDARPDSYPTTFGPDQDAEYVLEVVSGFASKYNLKVGDNVSF